MQKSEYYFLWNSKDILEIDVSLSNWMLLLLTACYSIIFVEKIKSKCQNTKYCNFVTGLKSWQKKVLLSIHYVFLQWKKRLVLS